MYKVILLLMTAVAVSTAQAQFKVNAKQPEEKNPVTSKTGRAMAALVNSLNEQSLNKAFAKQRAAFVKTANSAETPVELASALKGLLSGIKPTYLKTPTAAADLVKQAAAANTNAGIAALLKSTESNLKPTALNAFWKVQRDAWLKGLDEVK